MRYMGLVSEIMLSAGQNTIFTRQIRRRLAPDELRPPCSLTLEGSANRYAATLAGFGLQRSADCRKLILTTKAMELCPLIPVSSETPKSPPPPQ